MCIHEIKSAFRERFLAEKERKTKEVIPIRSVDSDHTNAVKTSRRKTERTEEEKIKDKLGTVFLSCSSCLFFFLLLFFVAPHCRSGNPVTKRGFLRTKHPAINRQRERGQLKTRFICRREDFLKWQETRRYVLIVSAALTKSGGWTGSYRRRHKRESCRRGATRLALILLRHCFYSTPPFPIAVSIVTANTLVSGVAVLMSRAQSTPLGNTSYTRTQSFLPPLKNTGKICF